MGQAASTVKQDAKHKGREKEFSEIDKSRALIQALRKLPLKQSSLVRELGSDNNEQIKVKHDDGNDASANESDTDNSEQIEIESDDRNDASAARELGSDNNEQIEVERNDGNDASANESDTDNNEQIEIERNDGNDASANESDTEAMPPAALYPTSFFGKSARGARLAGRASKLSEALASGDLYKINTAVMKTPESIFKQMPKSSLQEISRLLNMRPLRNHL